MAHIGSGNPQTGWNYKIFYSGAQFIAQDSDGDVYYANSSAVTTIQYVADNVDDGSVIYLQPPIDTTTSAVTITRSHIAFISDDNPTGLYNDGSQIELLVIDDSSATGGIVEGLQFTGLNLRRATFNSAGANHSIRKITFDNCYFQASGDTYVNCLKFDGDIDGETAFIHFINCRFYNSGEVINKGAIYIDAAARLGQCWLTDCTYSVGHANTNFIHIADGAHFGNSLWIDNLSYVGGSVANNYTGCKLIYAEGGSDDARGRIIFNNPRFEMNISPSADGFIDINDSSADQVLILQINHAYFYNGDDVAALINNACTHWIDAFYCGIELSHCHFELGAGKTFAIGATLNEAADFVVKLHGLSGALKSENTGDSTGTGAKQTIAHGLCKTPKRVQLIPTATGVTEASINQASDGTNIYPYVTNLKTYTWFASVEA